MLLRRITQHVKEQNWTAIAIDFVIVVVGVFIGIQVSNWNEVRGFQEREIRLLQELRQEVALNAKRNRVLAEGLQIGADSARRILAAAEGDDAACSVDCWSLVVDLMHASQWVRPLDTWPTYEELRRAGLPSERAVVENVERFKEISRRGSDGISTPPEYRTQVRRRLPVELQDAYWEHCWGQSGYGEVYTSPCEHPATVDAVSPSILEAVIRDEELMMQLTEWTSIALATRNGLLIDLQAAASAAIESIDGVISKEGG